jgi:hypothetical protein
VKVHIIRDDTGAVPLSYPDFTDSTLNVIFEDAAAIFLRDAHIELAFDSTIGYIDSDSILSLFPTGNLTIGQTLALKYKTPTAIDLFLLDNSAMSVDLFPTSIPYGATIITVDQVYDSSATGFHGRIVAHELGHLFGLLHTSDTKHGKELISRDAVFPGTSDTLCYFFGDHCCDTPAEPFDTQFDEDDCSLIDSLLIDSYDPDGYRYIDGIAGPRPDSANLMGIGRPVHCMTHFTPQQAMIMRCNYSSWAQQSFVKLVATNRTDSVANIGGEMIIVPPRDQLVANVHILVNSGDTMNVLLTNQIFSVLTRDTMRYNGDILRAEKWENDARKTDLVQYIIYDTLYSQQDNNNKCTSWFNALAESVVIGGSVDGIAVDSLPIMFFDPWKPSVLTGSPVMFGFPSTRPRYITTWVTNPNFLYKTPFSPLFGVFEDKRPASSNSFYRIAAPIAINAVSGEAFKPGSGSPLSAGDAVFREWSTDVPGDSTFFSKEIVTPWFTYPILFSTDDQQITAEFKGHLVATAGLESNGQRKIVHDGEKYWFLYNSGNRCWVTSNPSPSSEGWIQEMEITGLQSAGTASLDVRDGYLLSTAAKDDLWNVVLADTQIPDSLLKLEIPLDPNTDVTHAVVTKQSGAPYIVTIAQASSIQDGNHLRLVLLKDVGGGSGDYEIDTTIVIPPVANGIPANPSLACDESGAFHLVWEENENIYYLRFLVDGTGAIDSLFALAPDVLPECMMVMHGSNPSIAVDAYDRPHVAWQSTMYQLIETAAWTEFTVSECGKVIAHRYKSRPFSDPASATSWSRETVFAIEDHDGLSPVVGADHSVSAKVGVSWFSEEDSGRVHVALADINASGIQSWKRRTLSVSGTYPHLALRHDGDPLLAFCQPTELYGTGFYMLQTTQDTADVDFSVPSVLSPAEMRGAIVRNEQFTAGLHYRMYDDSLTGEAIPFVPVSDTTRINLYPQVPSVVRTEAFETSHLLFDIRRFIHGFTEGCDLGIFDTVSVTWWASIRNAENDTVVASVELGKLMRDSTFAGIDSVRIGFPHQNVYSELSVETNIDVFPCVEWASRVGIPRNEHEYSTQKEAWSAQRDFERTLSLGPVSPNPFASQAHIPYSVRAMGPVLLTIHDALGRRVATLVDGEQAEGTHSAIFDGSTLANGVYYCRLISGGRMITRRIHLIR